MIPAVSHPAVPPPTMTTAFTAWFKLELGAYAHGKGPANILNVQDLIVEPSVLHDGLVGQIQLASQIPLVR